jgi:hypothetical protein
MFGEPWRVRAAPMSVEKPKHPLYALTTNELTEYRNELEHAVTAPAADPRSRADLRRRLDDVPAEQDDRAWIAARA